MKPKAIPEFTGKAAETIIRMDQTPMTEEEVGKIDRSVNFFESYMEKILME